MLEMIEEKGIENPYREKGGYKARKKRRETIKESMENERCFQSLKREQGVRSGQEESFEMFGHYFY